MQCWHLHEKLRDQDEDIQIKSNRRGDGVSLAPGAGELLHVTSGNGYSQYDQRDDAEDVRRQQFMKREQEPGDAGQRSSHQEDGGPAVEALPGNHSEHGNESGEDTDQAQNHMNES